MILKLYVYADGINLLINENTGVTDISHHFETHFKEVTSDLTKYEVQAIK